MPHVGSQSLPQSCGVGIVAIGNSLFSATTSTKISKVVLTSKDTREQRSAYRQRYRHLSSTTFPRIQRRMLIWEGFEGLYRHVKLTEKFHSNIESTAFAIVVQKGANFLSEFSSKARVNMA